MSSLLQWIPATLSALPSYLFSSSFSRGTTDSQRAETDVDYYIHPSSLDITTDGAVEIRVDQTPEVQGPPHGEVEFAFDLHPGEHSRKSFLFDCPGSDNRIRATVSVLASSQLDSILAPDRMRIFIDPSKHPIRSYSISHSGGKIFISTEQVARDSVADEGTTEAEGRRDSSRTRLETDTAERDGVTIRGTDGCNLNVVPSESKITWKGINDWLASTSQSIDAQVKSDLEGYRLVADPKNGQLSLEIVPYS